MQDELCNKWATNAEALASLLISNDLEIEENADVIPFDAASENPIEDQK